MAQHNLGVLYLRGEGVVRNVDQALAWFRRAAEQNDALAQYQIGYMYENGLGVVADKEMAISWYRKAAGQGKQEAKERLRKLGP